MMTVGDRSRFRARQLALFPDSPFERRPVRVPNRRIASRSPMPPPVLCLTCRSKEARYGFCDEVEADRPPTRCFDCFILELEHRRRHAQMAARRAVYQ